MGSQAVKSPCFVCSDCFEGCADSLSDPTAATLYSNLLLHASQPYSRMLIKWITTGHLSDPFDEFMVKESGHITKGVLESDYTDEYWERRYTVRLFRRCNLHTSPYRATG